MLWYLVGLTVCLALVCSIAVSATTTIPPATKSSMSAPLILTAPGATSTATVILMHGLGDSAEGLRDIAQHWLSLYPHIKFILPTAPQRRVTVNGGRPMNAWYDIVPGVERTVETSPGIVESSQFVRSLLEKEIATGRALERVVLAGFSQGGSLSLFTGLQSQFVPGTGRLGGLIVLSGILVKDDALRVEERLRATKVFHCHGTADRVLPYQLAEESQRRAVAQGASHYELKSFPGAGHGVSREMLRDATAFLGSVLPPINEVQVN